jgi:peptide/nickel transport system substrate-binding protein
MTDFRLDRRSLMLGAAMLSLPSAARAGLDNDTMVIVAQRVITASPAPGTYQVQDEKRFGNAELLLRPTKDGPKPWLAESVKEIEPLRWRISLKPGLRFQNGSPLDAVALKACLDFYRTSPTNQSDPKATLLGSPVSVEVSSPLSVDLVLSKPYPRMPYGAAHYAFAIFDVAAVAGVGAEFGKLVNLGIFTGPFQWKSIEPGKVTYVRNEHYWGGRPRLGRLVVREVPDEMAGLQAIAAGEADFLGYPALSLALAAKAHRNVHFKVIDNVAFVGMLVKPTVAPFDDPRVRRALALSIDNGLIAQGVGLGLAKPMRGWFGPDTPLTDDYISFDPATAEKLLDEAGWRKGPDGRRAKDGKLLEARFYCYQAIGEAISTAAADMVSKVGFKASVRLFGHYSEIPPVQAADGGIYTVNTENIGYSGDALLTMYKDFDKPYAGHRFDDVVAVLEPALSSTDEAFVRDSIRKAVRLNAEQGYWLPIIDAGARFVLSDRYRNMPLNPFYFWLEPTTYPEG